MDETIKSRLICEMDATERPREKALTKGVKTLTDAELMAIIFATGLKGKSVIDLCHEILDANDNHLSRVATMTADDLTRQHKGIGKVKAVTLLAALELGDRAALDAKKMAGRSPVGSSKIAYELMRHRFQWLQHEEFWVMLINRAGMSIKEIRISQGGTCATTVDVKIIMREALQSLASSMILFHNHPSGTLRPSIEDDKLTDRIVGAAKYFDIRVNDHLIMADNGYYSYLDHGKI